LAAASFQNRAKTLAKYYTDAIEAAPYDEAGPAGVELLRLKLEFEQEARVERHLFEMEKRRGGSHYDNS
jgi:hypothetical protein